MKKRIVLSQWRFAYDWSEQNWKTHQNNPGGLLEYASRPFRKLSEFQTSFRTIDGTAVYKRKLFLWVTLKNFGAARFNNRSLQGQISKYRWIQVFRRPSNLDFSARFSSQMWSESCRRSLRDKYSLSRNFFYSLFLRIFNSGSDRCLTVHFEIKIGGSPNSLKIH